MVSVAVVLALALAGLLWFWSPLPEPAPVQLAVPPRGGDFGLQSGRGAAGLADLRGKVVLMYFGYTWCPDICPTNLAVMSQALAALTPEELAEVQVLFVSVDPERDSLERLEEYTAYFHPNILGLTGSPDALDRVVRQYGAAYRVAERDSGGGYLVDHSAFTYLVDPRGRLVETLEHASAPSQILGAIRRWLPNEGRP